MSTKHEVAVELSGGKRLVFETGRMAKQASGAALVSTGESVVLATAVASPDPREGIDFFPLTVDYREYTYAGGRIPGGFIKREGRPSEKEILTCRQIDRPLRPLFPDGFRNETQLIALVLSADKENDPDVIGINAAAAALALSDIPFNAIVGAVRVGRVNGEFVANPTYAERAATTVNIMVVGHKDGIVMIESGAKEETEEVILAAIEFAHTEIKKIVAAIEELVAKAGKQKRAFAAPEVDEAYYGELKAKIGDRLKDALDTKAHGKTESYALVKAIKDELAAELPADDPNAKKKLAHYYELLRERLFREQVTKERIRPDRRAFDEIRPISIETGVLPRTHGSALFTRGETQALVTATLGTADDGQRLESYEGEQRKNFMLHYNFPPFSVGETGRMTGVGRREVGHGALAERAISAVLPSADESPYSIRIVSDILESNGSSSMASVCGASLALFDSGIALKGAVAGVAMGLVKEGDDYAILTDIAGAEDHYGDMDFKVAGTRKGITALQMDIKIGGLTREILRQAMEQARQGRLFLLDKMDAVLDGPRVERSKYAPRIETVMIPTDKIRDLIGNSRHRGTDGREDRRGRHGQGERGIERRRGPAKGAGDHRQPDGSSRGGQDVPGQGGAAGRVWRICGAVPRHGWTAAHLRDRGASREGSEGRAARGRPGDGEGAGHRRQSHQAEPQGAHQRAKGEADAIGSGGGGRSGEYGACRKGGASESQKRRAAQRV
jgi:polyribonucleotide nucleotidyltransferase